MIKIATKYLISLSAYGLVNSKSQAYQILGLSDNADLKQINKAFTEKSKLYHPDINKKDTTKEMQLIIAARDFLRTVLQNLSQSEESVIEENSSEHDPDLSYEDIAKMKQEMGREEFDKKFPDWSNELKHEIGLDEYNRIFESYDPKNNYYAQEDQEKLWNHLRDHAEDQAYNLFSKLRDEGKLDFWTGVNDLMDKYVDFKSDEWLMKFIKNNHKMLEEYKKLFKKEYINIQDRNLDEFNFSFDDILNYPIAQSDYFQILGSFLSKDDNIEKTTFPDELLLNKEFARAFLIFASKNTEKAKLFLHKYGQNPNFLEGIFKSAFNLHWLKNHEELKNIILNLPFSNKQIPIVKHWLTY